MAIIDESGIKRDTDASEPLVRHPNSLRPQNTGNNVEVELRNEPQRSNLSNGSELKRSRSVAKPGKKSTESNPIERANQRRNNSNNYTKPTKPTKDNGNQEQGQSQNVGEDKNNNNKNNKDNKPSNNDSGNKTNAEAKAEGKEEKDKKSGLSPLPNSDNKEQGGGNEKDKIVTRIKNFIKKHPIVLLYVLLGLAIFIVIFLVIAAVVAILSGGAAIEVGVQEGKKNYGDFFAFDYTQVYILDENGNAPIGSRSVTISDYIKGIVYADTLSMDLSRLNDEQLKEFYSAIIVTKKAEILAKGNYNNRTKSISLKITDYNYCDHAYGCKLVTKNGRRFYLPNSIDYQVDSTISSIDAMDTNKKAILNEAYLDMFSKVVTPDSVKEPLSEYKWSPPVASTSTYNGWLSNALNGTKYENLVKGSFSGYKVYNLDDYALQFEGVYLSQYTLWWPIGSDTPDANGIYSDDPTSVTVLSSYGPSFSTQTINQGIVVYGICNTTKVTSMGPGTVTYVGSNEKYGQYVIIKHEDGVQGIYGYLSSSVVSVGKEVEAGSLIGYTGKIVNKDYCGLYLEVYKNGSTVNPLDYISSDNPRPSKAKYIKFVQGIDNKQTVCKTFLASGFNKNAVAGLMANIEHESSFRLDALSDGGTSNGLFQWHKGRLENLKSYCGNEYLTSIKCQLDFFYYEITETPNAQGGIFNYLMGNHTAYDMGYQFCMRFERPAGGAISARERGNLAESRYSSYVNNGCS